MPLRVRWVASDYQGGGHLRSFWPAAALKGRGIVTRAECLPPLPAEADCFIIHRPLDPGMPQVVERLRAQGKRVLVDEDDDLTRVPETNIIGKRIWTEERQAAHDAAIATADGLVVTTPGLQQVYGGMARATFLVRNALPFWVQGIQFHRLPNREYPVRVGWTGIVKTHAHDLQWLAPVVRYALEDALFSTVGDAGTPECLGVNGMPLEIFPFQYTLEDYYRMMARADVGIVPLSPTRFNVSKSWLKALEYMTLGKPVVVTRLPEQEALITHGVNGYLASSPEEFAHYVRLLVRDDEMRGIMGKRALERAQELSLDEEPQMQQWLAAIHGAAV